MKQIIVLGWIILFAGSSFAQTIKDSLAIKETALDYADGYYTGDAARMERAIYPDINKARPGKVTQTGNIAMGYSTYSGLIERTRSKAGVLEKGKRKLFVSVLNINDDVANAKLVSAKFNDYLQLVKIDNRWKIINVLWTKGLDSPDRIKDFKPEEEREAIASAAKEYMDGIFSGNTKRLESIVHPEYNRVTLRKMKGSERITFSKGKYSSLIENSNAKIGLVDEPKRIIEVNIIDIMDGLAVVEIYTESKFEYVQMFKAGGQWIVFNSIVKSNPNNSFYAHLPAIVGFPMPDFTLPVYGGGEFTLSENKGKNVLLIFPRGSTGKNWCTICQYCYIDYVERERTDHLKQKYNLEIVFVLPYDSVKISDFIKSIPKALEKVEKWKHPEQDVNLQKKESAEYANKMFRQKYEFTKENIPASLPILIDAERVVSKRMQLFTTFWDKASAEQNIPTTFIIDKNGIVAFKYQSQTTLDRPNWEHLENIIKGM